MKSCSSARDSLFRRLDIMYTACYNHFLAGLIDFMTVCRMKLRVNLSKYRVGISRQPWPPLPHTLALMPMKKIIIRPQWPLCPWLCPSSMQKAQVQRSGLALNYSHASAQQSLFQKRISVSLWFAQVESHHHINDLTGKPQPLNMSKWKNDTFSTGKQASLAGFDMIRNWLVW